LEFVSLSLEKEVYVQVARLRKGYGRDSAGESQCG